MKASFSDEFRLLVGRSGKVSFFQLCLFNGHYIIPPFCNGLTIVVRIAIVK
jgi:hypothetical protein